ncbi:MAG: glutamine--tRNA ligase, partial [Gammaproteobacteria bacterium HGW-Gammaproteobacteria-7]
VDVAHAVTAEARLYDRLFDAADPDDDSDGKGYAEHLNPASKRVQAIRVEPAAADAGPETRFQFERLGYFVTDRIDHRPEAPVFNRAVGLRDTWAKAGGN